MKAERFRGYTIGDRDACALLRRGNSWVVTEDGEALKEFADRKTADEFFEITRAAMIAARRNDL